jgi:hypothetical protein
MKTLTPEREIELETFLNNYLEESMGADDASLYVYRCEIVCCLHKPRAIPANSPSAEMYKSEFEDMAEQLIEKLAREPFELKCEIVSLGRNGFALAVE